MKRFKVFAVTFFVLTTVFTLGMMMVSAFEARGIYGGVVRLHVIAESDSDADQALKLKVRDAVLEELNKELADVKDKEEAEALLTESLPRIKQIAREAVSEEGFEYGVDVFLETEYYPTREYGEVRLPAGEYKSLRVVIGKGNGKNWWCVLYPPLCTGSADADEELAEAGFTPNQIHFITDSDGKGYVLKFKIAESLSKTVNKIKRLFRIG